MVFFGISECAQGVSSSGFKVFGRVFKGTRRDVDAIAMGLLLSQVRKMLPDGALLASLMVLVSSP